MFRSRALSCSSRLSSRRAVHAGPMWPRNERPHFAMKGSFGKRLSARRAACQVWLKAWDRDGEESGVSYLTPSPSVSDATRRVSAVEAKTASGDRRSSGEDVGVSLGLGYRSEKIEAVLLDPTDGVVSHRLR